MFGWFSRGKPEEPAKKAVPRSANLASLGIDPSIFEDPPLEEEEEGSNVASTDNLDVPPIDSALLHAYPLSYGI